MQTLFTPTQWDTAQDKQKWLDRFIRFLELGCPYSRFTNPLYRRLSIMFGHIALRDRAGFYSTWFDDAGKRADFIEHTLLSRIVGDPTDTWSDVEHALQNWLWGNPTLTTGYRDRAWAEAESNDFLTVVNILNNHSPEFAERVVLELLRITRR